MFGRAKISQDEMERMKSQLSMDQGFFDKMEEQQKTFEADVTEIDESYRQVETDVNQAKENMANASLLAQENAKVESELLQRIGDYTQQMEETETARGQFYEAVGQVAERMTELVEDNKHFTTPSKYLSGMPGNLRQINQEYMGQIQSLSEFGRTVGVLALNAAIEAGRMGDAGKQFMSAAEDIRSYATDFEQEVAALVGRFEENSRRVEELEEQISHMVSLLKENNVATAKLMKTCMELDSVGEELKKEAFSKEMGTLREQVLVLKNADEEIVKSEERNQIQMGDLSEEFDAQRRNQKEIFGIMDPLFRHVIERKA